MTQARTGFAAYATARTSALLAFAQALTSDDEAAAELTTEALARVHEAWLRLDEDPEPFAREVMVRSYLGGGRARRRAADGVARKDRAAWALVAVAGLSLGEAARVLDTAPAAVQRAVQRIEQHPAATAGPPGRPGTPNPAPGGAQRLDLDRVADRVGRARRQHRAAAVVVALAAVGVGSLVARTVLTARAVTPGPQPSAGTFAEFAEGGRLAGEASVPLSVGNAALDARSSTTRIGVAVSCDTATALAAQISVDGDPVLTLACGRDPVVQPDVPVQQGKSSRVGVQVVGSDGAARPGAVGTLHLAWYQPVAWSAYPLPPPPANPTPLPLPDPDPAAAYLTSADGRTDGNPVSRSFQIPEVFQVKASTVAPGRLTVRINGVQVAAFTSWDYEPHRYQTEPIDVGAFLLRNAGVVPDGRATLEVQATDFTDPQWYVVVEQAR